MTATLNKQVYPDLQLSNPLKLGDKNPKVRLIQEWLSLNGVSVSLDGDFGPATEAAVKRFQTKHSLQSDGIVEEKTFEALTKPMANVLKTISKDGESIASLTLKYAEQHLKEHPREIGGQNMGPWVRLYMDQHQGTAWPWCAGFACFLMKQACKDLGKELPFTPSYACTYMATSADQKKILLREPKPADRQKIKPGSIFLVQQTSTMWQHTGIVSSVGNNYFHTIEGNTNDDGSPEGYEVCERVRGFNRMDFILLS
jgi:hypothetical protein